MKHWRLVYLAIPLMILVFLGIMCVNGQKSPALCEGIGRETAVYRTSGCADEAQTAEYELNHYTEGQGEAPVWWDPDEDMAVEWVASCQQIKEVNNEAVSGENVITKLATQQVKSDNATEHTRLSDSNTQRVIDVGCPDYNVETVIYGWDGHRAEPWELQLMARIVYLEFLGCSQECCEAGADSILNLWDSGYFGNTLGGTLSATAENGALVYTTYGYVWDWTYDPDDLAWCLNLCEERFYQGPKWNCCFFQLYGFPAWAEPLYCMDDVYFSTGKGW